VHWSTDAYYEDPFILVILIQTIAAGKARRINRQVRREREGDDRREVIIEVFNNSSSRELPSPGGVDPA